MYFFWLGTFVYITKAAIFNQIIANTMFDYIGNIPGT